MPTPKQIMVHLCSHRTSTSNLRLLSPPSASTTADPPRLWARQFLLCRILSTLTRLKEHTMSSASILRAAGRGVCRSWSRPAVARFTPRTALHKTFKPAVCGFSSSSRMLSGDQEETFEEFTARYVSAAQGTTTPRDELRLSLRGQSRSIGWMGAQR